MITESINHAQALATQVFVAFVAHSIRLAANNLKKVIRLAANNFLEAKMRDGRRCLLACVYVRDKSEIRRKV